MNLTARFTQGVPEIKRYVLDYALDLAPSEVVTSVAIIGLSTSPNQSDATAPQLVINNVTPVPGGIQVVFYASGGISGGNYFVTFLATTSLEQEIEDTVAFNIRSFVS